MTFEQSVEACMRQCFNAFERDCYNGDVSITNGVMSPAPDCEWIWVKGSFKNDGLHHLTDYVDELNHGSLVDEQFTGEVWRLVPPKDFLEICKQVSDFTEKIHPYDPISESFGNYSHTNGRSESGNILTWQDSYGALLRTFCGNRMKTGVFW